MSKWEKLISRIRSLSKDLQFDELRQVLESYGYEMKRPGRGGSHCTFRKNGRRSITIPYHEPIKVPYVLKVKETIEMEENENNENS